MHQSYSVIEGLIFFNSCRRNMIYVMQLFTDNLEIPHPCWRKRIGNVIASWLYACITDYFISVTSVKCENCHEVLFSTSKKDVPKEKLMEPAEVIH